MNIYPWHEEIWQRVVNNTNKRLPNALLLHGRAGTGKLDFAKLLSKTLLCENPVDHQACQKCAKCLWFDEGNHPDFKFITPEDTEVADDAPKKKTNKKTQISVDQIRQLIQSLSLTNHEVNGLRVALIYPAEALNIASANALLKVLEEPPNNTIFILVSHQVRRLLPTIISRCQSVAMPIPKEQDAVSWLESQQMENASQSLAYHGGAPLAALQAGDSGLNAQLFKQLGMGSHLDVFLSTTLLIETGMEHAINALQKWTFDILLSKYTSKQYYHVQYGNALQALTKSVNLSALLDFQKQLIQAKQTANHPLNQELQLEHLLLQYKKVFV